MKFNQYTWNLYKNSSEGKATISSFSDRKEWIEEEQLLEQYNPSIKDNFNKEIICEILEDFWCYKVSDFEDIEYPSLDEAGCIYEGIISTGLRIEDKEVLKIGDFDLMLEYIPFLSMELNYLLGDYFFPYLYIDRFYELKKLADHFEIELPPIPKKPDYKSRCMYYWELCKVFYQFRTENNLTPDELSAFMYDYIPHLLQTEKKGDIPQPSQAWFIGGLIRGYGEQWTTGFWQSNQETKKGDILIHYETSPISAITCLWISQVDGVIDPFTHYYSNTYISNRIDVPHITLKDLQADEYFSKHPLIRKKFQGVNGWPLSSEDYSELLRMIKAKGFDIDTLPKLYAPALPNNLSISCERDVEVQLLEYYLNKMGWYENKDFIRQLPIHAGRGHRVFPDYALHYDNKPDYERAKVLIEAKFHMKNNQEIEEAFKQARSYANILESSVIVLCDKQCLIVYERKESFDRDKYVKYHWGELENPDKFNELKNKLNHK
ncbi:type I restriction endonuclease subunit R [Parabacteroides sp. AM08-6]|uniref:type I restriction endonuclease subunit R n=1 Tax=Parabacteroides sp. AM08-6 TaxID=2292053 RepID=UPI000EFFCB39|nr:type I restriction endonuclease subunit R [Parabacteroides sp. AM08-6]RHJ83492.1 type I restriction endonuclease subunit R [Parabacteroides sp. AM08-6]